MDRPEAVRGIAREKRYVGSDPMMGLIYPTMVLDIMINGSTQL